MALNKYKQPCNKTSSKIFMANALYHKIKISEKRDLFIYSFEKNICFLDQEKTNESPYL